MAKRKLCKYHAMVVRPDICSQVLCPQLTGAMDVYCEPTKQVVRGAIEIKAWIYPSPFGNIVYQYKEKGCIPCVITYVPNAKVVE